MPQMQLPVFYDGVNAITNDVGYQKTEDTVVYFYGTLPVFSHALDDVNSFRMIVSQFYVNGNVPQSVLTRVFQIKPLALKRWVKKYREAGPGGFFKSRKGGSRARILTAEVLEKVQARLDEGYTISQISKELGLSYDVLLKAVADGRLSKPQKNDTTQRASEVEPGSDHSDSSGSTTKSQRSAEDAQAAMGVATTNVFDRVLASIGGSDSAGQSQFGHCEDVRSGGVLLALPALLSCGLLRHSERFFSLPSGYYKLVNIFLLLAMMSLNRVNSIEQLRYCSPGEWGKLLGLDRCPGVKTLRKKIQQITGNEESVKGWASALSKDWIEAEATRDMTAGTLYYVDGHLRVYHGSQTKLPRHYVARQRLCLRATNDYWISQSDGQPVFKVNTLVDPGLLAVLEEQIVPQLSKDIPDQPSEEQLAKDPYLSVYRLVFDREGYSPGFFKRMWDQRIACQTYRKGSYERWAEEEFVATKVKLKTGQVAEWKLAERGVRIGSKKKEMIWVREIRKLTEKGHQTAILSTQYCADIESIAQEQFGRWSLENFFRYGRKSFNIDALVDYQLESIPDTVEVVN